MKLYFIRHGESEANLKKAYAGQTQVCLTEKGKQDALNAKRILESLHFDKVYSSDLLRAIDTQRIALPGYNGEQTSLLREIDVGELAGKTMKKCADEYGDEFLHNRQTYNFLPYGGENAGMVRERTRSFLTMLEHEEFENVAAFCHAGFIKCAIDVITKTEIDKYTFKCDNCSVNVFEYKNGKWNLVIWNYTGVIN